MLEATAREAGLKDVQVTSALLVGQPAAIVQQARETAADLIVAGRRARARARTVLPGSTAGRIVRQAHTP